MRTIDLTPTFAEACAICVAVLLRSDNPEAQRKAQLELIRYGRELDRLKALAGTAFDPADTPMAGE